MSIGIITIAFAVLAVVLFLLARALRFFVKLALVGILLLAFIVGFIAWRWSGFGNLPADERHPAPAARRAPPAR